MSQYKVYMYNIPKVSEDGKKSIPVPDCKTEDFGENQEKARQFMESKKDEFDRVVLMRESEEGEEKEQKLEERFIEGRLEVPKPD